MRIQARTNQIALEHSQAGTYATEEIALPAEALADFESRKDSAVRFEINQGNVIACWQDKAVPQIKQYVPSDHSKIPEMPAVPTRMDSQPIELLRALRDASEIAGTDVTRYAVNCIQLRGKLGQVISTDGRQMLAQSGFVFAWDDEVLIPASAVYGCRELHDQEPISLGRTDKHITLSLGSWTLHLAIDKDGRFPKVDSILSTTKGAATVLQLDPGDAQFLLGNLDSLPGASDDCSPVTVEGNGSLIIRAQSDNQPKATEVVLSRSSVQGKQVCFVMNRLNLLRAVRLGFSRMTVRDSDQPIICRDEKRQFVCVPLDKTGAVKSSDDAIHLSSTDGMPAPTASPVTTVPATAPVIPIKDEPSVEAPQSTLTITNGTERTGIAAVLAEAEAIKELLRQAYTRTHQLVTGVKRYRKQAQMVKSALGSLRQLQEVAD